MLLPSLLLLAGSPAAALFEDPCGSMRAAVTKEASHAGPANMVGTVTIEETGSFCASQKVIDVYVDGERHWVLRRISTQIGGPALPQISWAESGSCPTILTWLERLERLPIGFKVGPLRKGEKPRFEFHPPYAHGVHYEVRGNLVRQPSGAWARLSLSSNEGEVADWGRGFSEATAACWRPRPERATD